MDPFRLFPTTMGWAPDALGNPNRTRLHTTHSIEVKYYDRPEKISGQNGILVDRRARMRTGGGVSCLGDHGTDKKQSFLGYMFYQPLLVS